MSASRRARRDARRAQRQERAAQVQQLATEADRLAAQARKLDAAGCCREARQVERHALDAAMRAALLSMNIPFREPLPPEAVSRLDEAVFDVLAGDVEGAMERRHRALVAIAASRNERD